MSLRGSNKRTNTKRIYGLLRSGTATPFGSMRRNCVKKLNGNVQQEGEQIARWTPPFAVPQIGPQAIVAGPGGHHGAPKVGHTLRELR